MTLSMYIVFFLGFLTLDPSQCPCPLRQTHKIWICTVDSVRFSHHYETPYNRRPPKTSIDPVCGGWDMYLWSIETRARSSRCLLLNMLSLWGNSNKLGGPNGVQMANRASGGSSILRFWPWRTFTRPRMSSLCHNPKEEIEIILQIQIDKSIEPTRKK